MPRRIRLLEPLTLALLAAALMLAGSASGAPTVFFDGEPYCTENPGDLFTASIWVDASPDSIACFQLLFTYDRTYLELLLAEEGDLFANSGFPTFFTWSEQDADTTMFGDCLLGSGTFVQGPGELVQLEFRVRDCTDPTVVALDIVQNRTLPPPPRISWITDNNRMLIPNVTFTDASSPICHDCNPAGVGEASAPAAIGRLELTPNPAASEVRLAWRPPGAGGQSGTIAPARLAVFDAAGRLVLTRSLDGRTTGSFTWDLAGDRGERIAAGVYWIEVRSGGRAFAGKLVRID